MPLKFKKCNFIDCEQVFVPQFAKDLDDDFELVFAQDDLLYLFILSKFFLLKVLIVW